MAQDVKPAQMFRDVFLYAYETARYRGHRAELGIVRDAEIERTLRDGSHETVLATSPQ